MRVGICVEQLRQAVPGGIGTYARGLLAGIAQLGDVDLQAIPFASRATRGSAEEPMSITALSLGHRTVVALWDRGIDLRPGGLDVVHLTSFAGPLGRGSGPARSMMVHDLAWRHAPELTTARGARWHEASLVRALRSRAALIVPSRPIADELEEAGADRERIVVIPHGADHLPPADDGEVDAFLAAQGVEPDGRFLLSVSTLEPRKNMVRMVEAYEAAVEETGVRWPLVIVGPAGWGATMEPRAGVLLAGPASGEILAGLYARCASFLFVSVGEGFGLPPLEALAHGAPVIASTTTPSVRDAPGCVMVDPLSVSSISAAIVEMMTDEQARRAMARAGQQFASTQRWVDSARTHVELWGSLR